VINPVHVPADDPRLATCLQVKHRDFTVDEKKVTHIITSTTASGAQMMLYKLLISPSAAFDQDVVSLSQDNSLKVPLSEHGYDPMIANMRGWRIPGAVAALLRHAQTRQPDLIMGWMYHSCLMASLAAAGRKIPLVWNIRHSLHDIAHEKTNTRLIIRALSKLSKQPDAIVYNAKASAEQHVAFGFCEDRTVVIPNGFDCEMFSPGREKRQAFRASLQLKEGTKLIGLVARAHPQKNHPGLLRAFARAQFPPDQARLLLVGHGFDESNTSLKELVSDLGLADRVTLLGARSDIADILPALDILTLPSLWGEAFPNILGEAMACGVPCVVSDVGDCAWIVGETGFVLNPGDEDALSAALAEVARLAPDQLANRGAAARNRILTSFELKRIAKRYHDLYEEVWNRSQFSAGRTNSRQTQYE